MEQKIYATKLNLYNSTLGKLNSANDIISIRLNCSSFQSQKNPNQFSLQNKTNIKMFNFLPKKFPSLFLENQNKKSLKRNEKQNVISLKNLFLAQSVRARIIFLLPSPILRQQTDRINIQFLCQIERKFKHFFVKLKS